MPRNKHSSERFRKRKVKITKLHRHSHDLVSLEMEGL